jgi:hypothetical protein
MQVRGNAWQRRPLTRTVAAVKIRLENGQVVFVLPQPTGNAPVHLARRPSKTGKFPSVFEIPARWSFLPQMLGD